MTKVLSKEELVWARSFCVMHIQSDTCSNDEATAQATIDPKRIPIPRLVSTDRDAFVNDMGVLDALVPDSVRPGSFYATVNGKTVAVSAAKADDVKQRAAKTLQNAIKNVEYAAENAESHYEHVAPSRKEKVLTALSLGPVGFAATQFIDPTNDVDDLIGKARNMLMTATAIASTKSNFGMAAGLIADAEAKVEQADLMISVWEGRLQVSMSATITGLKVVKTVAFFVAGAIAESEGGPLAGTAMDVVEIAADTLGEIIAGEDVDWTSKAIEVGMTLLEGKFASRLKGAVGGVVEKFVVKKLAGRLAADKLNTVAKRVGEAVAKLVVHEGSALIGSALKSAAKTLEGTKQRTGESLMEATIAVLQDPTALLRGQIEALAETYLSDAISKAQ